MLYIHDEINQANKTQKMLGYAALQRHLLQRGEPPQRSDSPTYNYLITVS
jgi:hypothetical protein